MKPSTGRLVPAERTAAAAIDSRWVPPRLSSGQPDLEGVWTTDDMRGIPLARPAAQADREFLTDTEFERRAAADEANRYAAVHLETFLRNEFGTRSFGYTSLIVDPSTGQFPPFTPRGAALQEADRHHGTFGPGPFDSVEDFSLYDRCITRGVLGNLTPVLYGNGLLITQSPSEVAITYEMIHETRLIPLDDSSTVAPSLQSYTGYSRGHFEGDTLIIETTNFRDHIAQVNHMPHSHAMHMTEWLRRVDPAMIEYRVRIDDPEILQAPFTMRLMLTTQPDYDVYEYSCHEGNAAVTNALSGERAFDKAVDDAAAKGQPRPLRPPSDLSVYSGAVVEGREEVREIGVSPER